MLHQYQDDQNTFEWLYIFNKDTPDTRTLHNYLKSTTESYFNVRLKIPKIYQPVPMKNISMNFKQYGLLVIMFQDN